MKNSDIKQKIADSFSNIADVYENYAFLQKEIGQRVLERLEYIKLNPKTIIDLGSGTGYFIPKLQEQYKNSTIIGVDIAYNMCKIAAKNLKDKSSQFNICGDADKLPFASNSIDFIFSNCTIHLCPNLNNLFQEINRVLTKDGVFIFSTFGPDTLCELKHSIQNLFPNIPTIEFNDMHIIGDQMLKTLTDPVVDMEIITLAYDNLKQLLKDLEFTSSNIINDKDEFEKPININFLDPNINNEMFNKLNSYYQKYKNDSSIPATFEIIYGLGFGKETPLANPTKKKSIPINTKSDIN